MILFMISFQHWQAEIKTNDINILTNIINVFSEAITVPTTTTAPVTVTTAIHKRKRQPFINKAVAANAAPAAAAAPVSQPVAVAASPASAIERLDNLIKGPAISNQQADVTVHSASANQNLSIKGVLLNCHIKFEQIVCIDIIVSKDHGIRPFARSFIIICSVEASIC